MNQFFASKNYKLPNVLMQYMNQSFANKTQIDKVR